jgi:hypothetical protein
LLVSIQLIDEKLPFSAALIWLVTLVVMVAPPVPLAVTVVGLVAPAMGPVVKLGGSV